MLILFQVSVRSASNPMELGIKSGWFTPGRRSRLPVPFHVFQTPESRVPHLHPIQILSYPAIKCRKGKDTKRKAEPDKEGYFYVQRLHQCFLVLNGLISWSSILWFRRFAYLDGSTARHKSSLFHQGQFASRLRSASPPPPDACIPTPMRWPVAVQAKFSYGVCFGCAPVFHVLRVA